MAWWLVREKAIRGDLLTLQEEGDVRVARRRAAVSRRAERLCRAWLLRPPAAGDATGGPLFCAACGCDRPCWIGLLSAPGRQLLSFPLHHPSRRSIGIRATALSYRPILLVSSSAFFAQRLHFPCASLARVFFLRISCARRRPDHREQDYTEQTKETHNPSPCG